MSLRHRAFSVARRQYAREPCYHSAFRETVLEDERRLAAKNKQSIDEGKIIWQTNTGDKSDWTDNLDSKVDVFFTGVLAGALGTLCLMHTVAHNLKSQPPLVVLNDDSTKPPK